VSPDATPNGLVTAVVGNPKPRSRTFDVALECARRVADVIGALDVEAVDLAELGPRLLVWNDDAVQAVVERMRTSAVVVVASPTYKGTYTGILKLLFDQIPADALLGTVGVPLMLGGAPVHALAVEVHLRPLLVEVGLACPTRGLYVLESQLEDLASVLVPWVDRWRGLLRGS
jgi:FMN reductase